MKRFIYLSAGVFMALLAVQCTGVDKTKEAEAVVAAGGQIPEYSHFVKAIENRQAWEEATFMVVASHQYLNIEGGMSDDAICPINPRTGLVENRAKNIKIYVTALERVREALVLEDNRLVLPLGVSSYYNMSEDLFQFICMVIGEWNTSVAQGVCKFIRLKNGNYDVVPVDYQPCADGSGLCGLS